MARRDWLRWQMGPDLISVAEAAKRLDISDTKAYRLIHAAEFPAGAAIHVSGRWRISAPRLNRYLGVERTDPSGGVADRLTRLERAVVRISVAVDQLEQLADRDFW